MENKQKLSDQIISPFSVAPMLEWTDRHCRYLHRLLSKKALLYTEMVTVPAIIHGDRDKLLGYDAAEHPIAIQLAGSEPESMAEAVRIVQDWGYDEINLNAGCPSDRVQSGRFGACLMAEDDLLARLIEVMKKTSQVPVTLKCRIGIDDQDGEESLDRVIDKVLNAGCDGLIVHARKAWLQGLSPKENRDVPPLDYDRVYRLKQRLPDILIAINGGIDNLEAAETHLAKMDGVMLGRAAYHNPALLAQVDRRIFAVPGDADLFDVAEQMIAYIDAHVRKGGRVNQITRHMLGLFQKCPGARRWRQILTTESVRPDATSEVLRKAIRTVQTEA